MTSAQAIIDLLGAADRVRWLTEPQPALDIKGPAPLRGSEPGTISFLTAAAARPDSLGTAQASIVIVDRATHFDDSALAASAVAALIASDNPRLDFIRVMDAHFVHHPDPSIHPSAVVSASARIGDDVSIGPLCTIGDRCEIGAGSSLAAGVHLYSDVVLGRRVHLQAGVVIGAAGFGFERDEDGALVRFPHLGHVEIGDDVEVGANTCIDRGALGPTRIGRGVKVNNQVHIAHNVVIGPDCIVTANVMVAGSTHIGARTWIGPSACLRDNIRIGDDVTIGLGAVVTNDVPAGATFMGAPARAAAEHRRLLASWRAAADTTS